MSDAQQPVSEPVAAAEPTATTPKKNGTAEAAAANNGGEPEVLNGKPVVDEESRDSQEDEENGQGGEDEEDEEGEGDEEDEEEEEEEGEEEGAEAVEKNGKHAANGDSKVRKRVSDPTGADSNDGTESSPSKKKTKTDDSQGAEEGVATAE